MTLRKMSFPGQFLMFVCLKPSVFYKYVKHCSYSPLFVVWAEDVLNASLICLLAWMSTKLHAGTCVTVLIWNFTLFGRRLHCLHWLKLWVSTLVQCLVEMHQLTSQMPKVDNFQRPVSHVSSYVLAHFMHAQRAHSGTGKKLCALS